MATLNKEDASISPNTTNLTGMFQELDLNNPTEKATLLAKLKDFHHGTLQPKTPNLPSFPHGLEPIRHPETLPSTIVVNEVEGKGLGLFAAREIPAGTVLLFELPIISYIKADRTHSKLSKIITSLTPSRRKVWYSLHAYMANTQTKSIDVGILHTNGFSIKNDMATGVFETASRINHSCVPNSMWDWKEESGRMMFWNRWALMEGEEVTVDYGHCKSSLRNWYGFECDCGGCTEDGSESEGEEDVIDGMTYEGKAREELKEDVGTLIREVLEDGKSGDNEKYPSQENTVGRNKLVTMDESNVVGGAGADSDDYSDDYSDGIPEYNGVDGDDDIDGADWARHEERGWMGGRS